MGMKLADVPKDVCDTIVQMYESGATVPAVLKHLDDHDHDVTLKMIYKVLRVRGVTMRESKTKYRADVPAAQVQELAAYGFKQGEIAAFYGSSVYLIASRMWSVTPEGERKHSPRRSKKAEALAEELVRRFESGEYSTGEKLPCVRLMSVRFGVSHDTMRKALAAVRKEGWIETLTGAEAGRHSGHYYLSAPA